MAAGGEPVDLLRREAQVFEEVESLIKASCNQKATSRGQFAHEEFEYGCLGFATVSPYH
jgi:hypothetical protein